MVARIAVSVLLGLMMTAPSLNAHPLHVTYSEVRREQGDFITMSVRLFADDFGALVDSLSRTTDQTKSTSAQRYVQRSLTLSLRDGTTIATDWCGQRSDQNLVWVCLRSARPVPGRFRLRNALMFDRFSDQISIIRWTNKNETRTLVLSARVPEGRLE